MRWLPRRQLFCYFPLRFFPTPQVFSAGFAFHFQANLFEFSPLEFSEIVQQILVGTHCCMQILVAALQLSYADTDTATYVSTHTDTFSTIAVVVVVVGGNCHECCYFSLTCTFTLRGLCLSFDVHFLFMFTQPWHK